MYSNKQRLKSLREDTLCQIFYGNAEWLLHFFRQAFRRRYGFGPSGLP